MIGLLADGHILLEGAPGLAKTRVARLLAHGMEGVFKRIQFTPDLLPSDLTGSSIYDAREQRFDFQTGPVFGNFILADEINRAPAKVQSALLEAMEERQVTSGTKTFKLEAPFFVIATQNPIEHEGTWELPQAQLDRFLLHVTVDYPDLATERDILDLVLQEAVDALTPSEASTPIPKADLAEARRLVLDVHLSDPIRDYIVRLMSGTRGDPEKPERSGRAPVPSCEPARIGVTGANRAGARLVNGTRSRAAGGCIRAGSRRLAASDGSDLSRRSGRR